MEKTYKKTATIKATQWFDYGDHPAVKKQIFKFAGEENLTEEYAVIETLEGPHLVSPGDWIATGIDGEHWPIKPDIFEKTYEEVV